MFSIYPNLPYRMVQDTREGGSGKWYAKSVSLGTISWDQFITHVATHNSTFDKSAITAVMSLFVSTAEEVMASGYKVRFGDLGTLRLAICSDGSGDIWAPTKEAFSISENIVATRLAFSPSRANRYNLSGTSLGGKSTFYNVEKMVKNSGSATEQGV